MLDEIITTIKDNWALTTILTGITTYFVYTKIKTKIQERKERKKIMNEHKLIKINIPVEDKKMEETYKEIQPPKKPEETEKEIILREIFEATPKKTEETTSNDLDELSKHIHNDSDTIVKRILQEKEDQKNELVEITKKKREIQKRGIELAQLFEIYKERETQLIQRLRK